MRVGAEYLQLTDSRRRLTTPSGPLIFTNADVRERRSGHATLSLHNRTAQRGRMQCKVMVPAFGGQFPRVGGCSTTVGLSWFGRFKRGAAGCRDQPSACIGHSHERITPASSVEATSPDSVLRSRRRSDRNYLDSARHPASEDFCCGPLTRSCRHRFPGSRKGE
jgi:hypothetical protein